MNRYRAAAIVAIVAILTALSASAAEVITLTASPNPSTFGQPVTLTFSVSFTSFTGSQVSFYDGPALAANLIGTAPLSSSGKAVITKSNFTAGTHNLLASFNTSSALQTGGVPVSATTTLVVNQLSTSVVMTASPNPASSGQAVDLTAVETPNNLAGIVAFFDGQTQLPSPANLGPGIWFLRATFTAGVHTLTASYLGDANTLASTSPSVTLNVGTPGPVTITSLSPGTAAASGAAFTLTVNGSGFAAGATAQWNGTPLTTTFSSATQLTATVPATLLASAGAAIVKVISGGTTSAGSTFTVNPPGQSCTFILSPLSATFGSIGGSGSIAVAASRTDCTWTAASTAPWITFLNPTLTGSATLNYNVAANPGASSRAGTITIGARIFPVNQGGTSCVYSLPVASQAFGPAAGNASAAVQAPPGCTWSASSNVPWVTITPPGSGSGNGTAPFTLAANPSPTARFGTLTIANLPYNVTQAGSGTNLSCIASAAATPQVALEGLTEAAGGVVIVCAGLTGSIKADITLTLNTNVTNPLNGSINPLLSVNGASPLSGVVTGYNAIRFPGVLLTPAAGGTVNLAISQVCANATQGQVPGNLQPIQITGQITIGALVAVPVTGASQIIAVASPALVFTRLQASPPAGGQSTFVPLLFQEAAAASFQASTTRLRVVLTNVPSTVQLFAPVFPAEGTSRAQLFSADANGAGGSPVSGALQAGALYQQLTVSGGTATATWLVLAADAAQVETWTFPLLIQNAAAADLNQIQVAATLGPVSAVSVASPTAPVPRYRDFSVPQKLVNLRMHTTVQVQPAGSLANVSTRGLAPEVAALAPIAVGSKVTFTHDLVNDTSDPTQTATNVVIKDSLPSGLNLISCTATGATCGGSGNQIQVTYGSVGPGQGATVTVTAQVDPTLTSGTVLENPVSVGSDDSNADLGAATASASFIALSGTPVVVGGSPASGSGNAQQFTFQFSHPSGFQNLGVVNILINNGVDGRNACYLAYSVQAATLFLVNDAGQAGGPFAGTAPLGSATPIENSQCAVTLVSAQGSGNILPLVLNITFKPAFGGNRIMFVAARDQAQGNTDWQALGVWQVPFTPPVAISVTSVTPARGAGPSGTGAQFKVTLTDTKGAGDFGVVNLLINNSIDGRHACYLAYATSISALILVDDAGDAGGPFAGSMPLNGSNTGIENSQCAVNGSGSSVSFANGAITLTLNITFKPAFAGNRILFVAGRDRSDGNNTDWQAVGTWTVQ